jgi:predicted DNA-binding transcriptional regulator YafY
MVDHILRASLDRELIVAIMYIKGTEITMRNIKVLNMDKDHIKAYCYLRKQNRVFKKENILSAAFINTGNTNKIYV